MRLIRLVKLYKHAQQALIEKEKKMLAEKAEKENQEKGGGETGRRNSQQNIDQHHKSSDNLPSKVITSKENEPMIQQSNEDENNQENQQRVTSEPNENQGSREGEFPQESNVGRKLSDLTTKRVITLVLSIIISIPLLNQETYVEDTTSHEAGLRLIHLWAPTTFADYNGKNYTDYDMFNLTTTTYINEYKDTSPKLVYLKLAIGADNAILYNSMDPNDLRTSEKQIFVYGVIFYNFI